MFKKIAASVALAGALAFSAAAPAVVSAAPLLDVVSSVVAGPIGNWPDPMRSSNAGPIGNWPDPMSSKTAPTYSPSYIGNWPDPM